MRKGERVFSVLAVLGSLIGAAGLLFLSIFDIRRYLGAHHALLVVFIVGVGLSVTFSIIEVFTFLKPKFCYVIRNSPRRLVSLDQRGLSWPQRYKNGLYRKSYYWYRFIINASCSRVY